MGAAKPLRESILVKGPVSLVLGLGVIILCSALVAVSALALVITLPATLLRRGWSRLVAGRH